jgi:hypothetical protein
MQNQQDHRRVPESTPPRIPRRRTISDHLIDEINSELLAQPTSSRIRQAAHQALQRTSNNRNPRVFRNTTNPEIHPQFQNKAVCELFCSHCSSVLCERGMRAILLGNTMVELFSTDRPPKGVALVAKDYFTKNCSYY